MNYYEIVKACKPVTCKAFPYAVIVVFNHKPLDTAVMTFSNLRDVHRFTSRMCRIYNRESRPLLDYHVTLENENTCQVDVGVTRERLNNVLTNSRLMRMENAKEKTLIIDIRYVGVDK